MTEGVQATLGIERRTISGGKNYAGGSDRGADNSRACDAHAYGSCRLIAGTGNYGSASAKTDCVRVSRRQFAANFLRLKKLWKKFHIDTGLGQNFV